MTIVIGRGKRRVVAELPCGAILGSVSKTDPDQYSAGLVMLCSIIGIENEK